MALFHFANAPILLLLGMELEEHHPGSVTLLMSLAIVVAQLVSIPIALLVGTRADRWGRKPLLLLGLAALPLRPLLYAVTDHPAWARRVQDRRRGADRSWPVGPAEPRPGDGRVVSTSALDASHERAAQGGRGWGRPWPRTR
jgi:hypothetical protein